MKRNPQGRLELTWMGKDQALIPVESGKYDYTWVSPTDPRVLEVKSIETIEQVGEVDGPNGANENLLIIGDSGDALRSLGTIPEYAEKYVGQVKLVYIDPPFNTEQAFEHYADQLEHSIWLTMMRDRIRSMKPLLAPDASVWVHLDDSEVHRMRVLLDEEFGADNFIGEVVWQKADSTRNDAKGLSGDHDTILAYRASPQWEPNRLPRTRGSNRRFSSPDGDPTPWFDGDPTAPGARTHQGMVYAIQHPITGELHYPARGRHWWTDQEQLLGLMGEYARYELRDIGDEDQRAQLCGLTPRDVRQGVPALMLAEPLHSSAQSASSRLAKSPLPVVILRSGGQGGLGRKSYVPETGLVPSTWWSNEIAGHNREAKAELKALFHDVSLFDTPKPERLLARILQIASDPGDLILDFFVGSGTTAAVAHKMDRRWLAVELQRATAETFVIPRLTKVVAGEDPGGVTSMVERVEVAQLPGNVLPEEAHSFSSLLTKFTDGQELNINVVRETARYARTAAKTDEPALSAEETKTLLRLLRKLGKGSDEDIEIDVMPQVRRDLRAAARTRKEKTVLWEGGGGFTVAEMGPTMYDVDDEGGTVYLSSNATNGAWSKAIAGQLKFSLTPEHSVFCGVRNRQRLAVIDGVVDEQVVRTAVQHLEERERAVIVAKAVLPEAEQLLQKLAPGSRIKKAPSDIFPNGTVK